MAGRSQSYIKSRRKRPGPSIFSSISEMSDDAHNDFVCPICFELMDSAYMTKCGHSFCHKCIKLSLDQSNRCPKCNFTIEKKEDIFPNFLLNELILKYQQKVIEQKKIKLDQPNDLEYFDSESLNLTNVNNMMEVLRRRKLKLENNHSMAQSQVLKEFLELVHKRKKDELDRITCEFQLIEQDISNVDLQLAKHVIDVSEESIVNGKEGPSSKYLNSNSPDGFNGCKNSTQQWLNSTLASRRKRIDQHFGDLEQCYFNTRKHPAVGASEVALCGDFGLDEFSHSLSKFTQFSSARTLATLNYASDIYNSSSIVSSIEFDRDCDYFAIAGVTKKIKLFEYGTVIRDQVDMHYPVNEMLCNSKISSIVWSSYHKGMLASSDYDGIVTIWDAFTGVKTMTFQEHEKRCWSVDFNAMDPNLLASGSDDSRVKLWYTNMEHSIASLEAKANVCCVKFNPESRYHLAFGSADHCVHYYDLRNTKEPLSVFKGHRKAVSYAKFLNGTEMVSASTDSQLKLWSLNKQHSIRTFRGHSNEKNFVGLATDGDYVACGSENNSLYVYYKGLSKEILTYKFDTVRSVLEKEQKEDDSNEFVSAVTWRPGSDVVVAANSQGIIKILELV